MDLDHKKQVHQTIAREFAKVLSLPENPFSMDNPDVVVAKGKHLYAIYIPNYSERENYDHLLRRLHLSQLSFSMRFIPILLLDADDKLSQNGWRVMEESFAHISMSIKDMIEFINNGRRFNKRWDVINEFQQEHFLRYKAMSDLSIVVRAEHKTDFIQLSRNFGDPFSQRSWIEKNAEWSIRNVYKNQFGIIASKNKGKCSFRETFQKLMTASFMSEFCYDNGYIYPHNNNAWGTVNVLNTDWSIYDNDDTPNRYNSMLAFAGLIPVCIGSEDELNYIYNKSQEILRHVFEE